MRTKKGLKRLKKRIVEESAINVGYHNSVINSLPEYAMIEAIKEISTNGWVNNQTPDAEVINMLVSESVKQCNYQDFKEVSKYFF